MSGSGCAVTGQVAVLGCGKMGSQIARTLAEAGHSVVVWNRTASKAQELAAGSQRITAVDTIAEAAAAAPVVISIVLSYDDALKVFNQFGAARPEVVLNFTTGFNQDATRAEEFCAERGLGYLDGIIACYPPYIGRPDTALFVAGPEALWQLVADLVVELGGASRYVGSNIRAANTLDTGVVGAYSMAATNAFLEALAFMLDEGVDPEHIKVALDAVNPIVNDSYEDALRAAVARSYPAEKVTLEVLTYGLRGFIGAIAASGHTAGALQAALDNCEAAAGPDNDQLSFYSVVEQLRQR